MTAELLFENFETLAEAPNGIAKLRELILRLAVQGKLVAQDPKDESASVLLKKICEEKELLAAGKKIRIGDPLTPIEPEEYPFDLPMGWEWCKLGDIGTTNIGLTYSPGDIAKIGIPVLRSNNIQKRKIDLNNLVRVNKSINENLIIQKGDLLICARNGSKALVGKTAQIKEISEKMAFGAFMAIFRSCCNDFVEVYLNSPEFRKNLEGVSTTTINQITQANLKNSFLPLPPLAEQYRIVAKVDELMVLCDELERKQNEMRTLRIAFNDSALTHLMEAKEPKEFATHWNRIKNNFDMLYDTPETVGKLRQTILQLAVQGKLMPQEVNDEPASILLDKIRQHKQSLITEKKGKKNDLVTKIKIDDYPYELPKGWEWVRCDDISRAIEYGTSVKSFLSNTGVPVIRMGDIQEGKVLLSNLKMVPATIEDLPKLYLKHNELLFNRTNSAELVGKTGIFKGQSDHYTFASYLIRLCIYDEYISPDYVNLAMNAPWYRKTQIEPELTQQCGQANFNGTKLKESLIPLPPYDEQKRIVAKVDEMMVLCNEMEQHLITVESVCTALMESVVSRSSNLN
jgi:type I restriction enzyme, S subunit